MIYKIMIINHINPGINFTNWSAITEEVEYWRISFSAYMGATGFVKLRGGLIYIF